MSAPFLTASQVDLFRACRASATMPRTREESEAATAGTERHAEVLRPGAMPAAFLAWFGDEPRYEAAFAWDGRRAVFLGEGLDRAYELPTHDAGSALADLVLEAVAGARRTAYGPVVYDSVLDRLQAAALAYDPTDRSLWLAGTADACSVRGRVLSVADLKTGYRQARGSLPPPRGAGQLRLLAWLLWQYRDSEHPGWEPERIRVAWHLHADGGEPLVEDAELDPAELRAWATRLHAAALAARDGLPEARPGEHCARCGGFDACPAQGQAIRHLSESPDPIVTDSDAGAAWSAIQAAQRRLDRTRQAVRTYLERRAAEHRAGRAEEPDADIGGGKLLRLSRSSRTEVDADLALSSGVLPPEAARVSVSSETISSWLADSPRQISSVRPLMIGEEDRPATADDLIALLEAVGAARKTVTAAFPQVVRRR